MMRHCVVKTLSIIAINKLGHHANVMNCDKILSHHERRKKKCSVGQERSVVVLQKAYFIYNAKKGL